MKKIFGSIFAVYVLLLFFMCAAIMLALYIPLLLLPSDRIRMKCIYFINKIMMKWIWSSLTGIWIRIEGRQKLDNDKTYVLVCNHSNMLDIPFMASCVEMYFKPLVKKEIFKVPIVGSLFRMTSIPVDRHNAESRRQSTQVMIDALKGGLSLMLFPEGTRNRTPEPTKEFYDGAFKVAIAAQVPIAPMVLINIRSLQPVDEIRVYPGIVTMRFLDPIPTVGMTEADTPMLRDRVRAIISEVLLHEDRMYRR